MMIMMIMMMSRRRQRRIHMIISTRKCNTRSTSVVKLVRSSRFTTGTQIRTRPLTSSTSSKARRRFHHGMIHQVTFLLVILSFLLGTVQGWVPQPHQRHHRHQQRTSRSLHQNGKKRSPRLSRRPESATAQDSLPWTGWILPSMQQQQQQTQNKMPSSLVSPLFALSKDSETDDSSRSTTKTNSPTYSDDFFGLIFLGGSIGLRDVVFGAVFLVVSFVAATISSFSSSSSRVNVIQLPGIVALVSVVLAIALKQALVAGVLPLKDVGITELLPALTIDPQSATLAEIAVCIASFVYTSFWKKEQASTFRRKY